MDHQRNLALLLEDDDAFRQYLKDNVDMDQLGTLLQDLLRKRVSRQRAVREYNERLVQKAGAASSWELLRNNPEAYQKHREYQREWVKRKRAASKPDLKKQVDLDQVRRDEQ